MSFDPLKSIPRENQTAIVVNIATLMFFSFVVGAIGGMWFAATACK